MGEWLAEMFGQTEVTRREEGMARAGMAPATETRETWHAGSVTKDREAGTRGAMCVAVPVRGAVQGPEKKYHTIHPAQQQPYRGPP